MANEQSGIKFFVVVTLLCLVRGGFCAKDEGGDASPLFEAVQQLLQDSTKDQNASPGLSLIGNLVQGFLQSGGGGKEQQKLGLLSGLSMLLNAGKDRANKNNEQDEGGFDPSALGTIMDIISTFSQGADTDKREKRTVEEQNAIDWNSIIGVLGSLASSAGKSSDDSEGGGSGLESLISFLPVLMSSVSGKHNPHSSSNVPHHTHPTFLPPFLENIHEYWDHFTSSQFGRTLWENSGLASLSRQFQDEDGNFASERLFESLENNIQRRRWIKAISSFVAEWANHISNAETQVKYLESIQMLTNGFLQSEGYPKKTHIDLKKPGDSISALVDEVFSRNLNLQVNSGTYIKPAISYFQDILMVTRQRGLFSGLTSTTIESKLSSSLEADLIEPILRANRAYRFALRDQSCARYVLCVINKSNESDTKASIKPAVVKASSMVTAWFLSTPTRITFLELYGSSAESSCKQFDRNCADFHEEDTKATTDYFHNEL